MTTTTYWRAKWRRAADSGAAAAVLGLTLSLALVLFGGPGG